MDFARTLGRASVLLALLVAIICGTKITRVSKEAGRLKARIAELEAELLSVRANVTERADLPRAEPPPAAPPNETNGTAPDPVSENEITRKDIEDALALNERARGGEYILLFERPTDRKVVRASIAELVATISSNNAPTLRSALARAGVPLAKAQQLEQHQSKIQQASLEVETAMQQLLEARMEYDRRAKSVMSESDYASYREFESTKSAGSEYERLQAYAATQNATLSEAYRDSVIKLIHDAGAYTDRSWHGPYDSLPEPAVGTEMVSEQLNDQIATLQQASSDLRSKTADAQLPSEYQSLLNAYYLEAVSTKRRILEGLQTPPSPPPGVLASRGATQ